MMVVTAISMSSSSGSILFKYGLFNDAVSRSFECGKNNEWDRTWKEAVVA